MKKTILKTCFILLLVAGGIYSNAQTWTQKANFSGAVREDAVGFSIGHYGFIGNGTNGNSTYYNDFYKWNQTTNTWSAIASYPGLGKFLCIAFSIEGKGYVGLGSTGSTEATDLWQYDTTSNSWAAMTSLPSGGRYESSVFVVGHKAYVIGGSSGGPPYYNEVWMYDAHQNTWTQKNNCPQGNIEGMVTFTIGNHGYIGGGWNSTAFLSAFWQYDTTNDSWTSITSIPLSGGIGGVPYTFVIGSKAYVCNGYTGLSEKALSDGYVYDTNTHAWSVFTNMGANGIERYYSVAFTIGNDGYMGTGQDSTTAIHNDFWQFTPQNTTGVNEVSATNSTISVYPNPSSGKFTLSCHFEQSEESLPIIEVYNLLGEKVIAETLRSTQGDNTIDLSSQPNGIYFYQVTYSGKLVSSGKIIIAK